ncbi:MAG: hypothetical protein EAX81_01800 [Candidatus Thorarchaeota archaeon]|nr:hypothetical protein [Candidatus Thorarchaeota archaeon]
MANSRVRYFIPTFIFLLGAYYSVDMILRVTEAIPPIETYNIMNVPITIDLAVFLVAAIPAYIIEFALLAIPGAMLLLLFAKTWRAASYEINIMNIGTNFGGVRMVRRALAPALFSLSSSAQLQAPIQNFLFGGVPVIPGGMELQYRIALTLMSSLLFLLVSLALFMPTWVLNDSGIVSHLRDDKLEVRQCPDTQGVGRWVGNVLGGYALVAYPISMFEKYFWTPLSVEGAAFIASGDWMLSIIWVIGLPFLVMAFVLPAVGANELAQKRIRKRITSFASNLGSVVVLKPHIEKIDTEKALAARKKHIKKEGILETEEVAEIIISQKEFKKPKKTAKKKTSKKKK